MFIHDGVRLRAFKKSIGLNGVGTKAVNALSSSFIVSSTREGRTKSAEFKLGVLSNEKLDTILNNFIYNSSIEIKNMLKKLDSDLQCSISSNMMVENIIEIVEICKKDTIEELEMVLNIKG